MCQHYLFIAKGSSGELKTQLLIAEEVGYLKEEDARRLVEETEKAGAMLGALIRTLKAGRKKHREEQ
ncbi:MAG: four helix bundle protein [Nitrospirales bacterium]